MDVDAVEIEAARKAITETQGDVVIMFGGELSDAAQAVVAQMPYTLWRRRPSCAAASSAAL